MNLPSTARFVYDLNGNLTSDGARRFIYDDENQLIQVSGDDWKTEFVYDGKMRRRISRHYKNVAGGSTLVTNVGVGALRNNHTGWLGFRLLVGANSLSVSQLGRWVVSGNSGVHAVKLVAGDGTDIPGASTTVNTAGAAAGRPACA